VSLFPLQSAIMAGMKVVPVKVLPTGYLDMEDLKAKAKKHSKDLAAFMVTYPSTFGVFESGVEIACSVIHENGGQVSLHYFLLSNLVPY